MVPVSDIQPTHHRPSVGLALILGASSYLLLLVAMVVFLGGASPPPHLAPAFTDDAGRFVLYRLAFVSAFLLGFSLVPVLVLLVVARGAAAITDLIGLLFLMAYLPLSSAAYASQWALLPRLLDGHPVVAASWYFHDSHSIPYVLDLLGYTLFGTAAALISLGFLARPGVWRWLGLALGASGLTSVAAFAALGAGMETLHSILSISSAVLTLPVAGAAILVGRRLRSPSAAPEAIPGPILDAT